MAQKQIYVAQNGKIVPWEVPLRELGPSEVRVKVHSVGINPIDWKTIDNKFADGAGQGNDFAGTVIEIGSEVKHTAVGDTVAGGVAGGDVDNTEQGAFTDQLSVEEHLLFKFPTKLEAAAESSILGGLPTTFEQAASLGIAADTTAIAFEGYEQPAEGSWAVIYGVTSSLGYVAAQYARNLGYKVAGVSAPTSVLKGLDIEWFDRHDPQWVEKVKAATENRATFAFDTICLDDSFNTVAQTLTTAGPSVLALPAVVKPEQLKLGPLTKHTHPVYFHLMQETKKLGPFALADHSKTVKRAPQLVAQINAQLAKQLIRALPIHVLHGFDKLEEGLDMNRRGVKGTKVVVDV